MVEYEFAWFYLYCFTTDFMMYLWFAPTGNLLRQSVHRQRRAVEQPATDSGFDEANGEKKKKNENLKTSPDTEQT